ncbi:MAG: hypothetical protein ACOYO1_19895 [Bacteroidales bacterium]
MKRLIKIGLIASFVLFSINIYSQSKPGKINKVQITYKEKGIDSEETSDGTEILPNKGTSNFDGCLRQELKELIIQGLAKKISIVIKDNKGKIIFEKKDFDINGSITFTKNDKKDIDVLFYGSSIIIKQNTTTLFNFKITNSGCM